MMTPSTLSPQRSLDCRRNSSIVKRSATKDGQPQPTAATATTTTAANPTPAAKQQKPRRHTPLHDNVVDFARRVAMTPNERRAKQRVIDAVRAAARRAFANEGGGGGGWGRGGGGPQSPPTSPSTVRVEAFGSFVSGTSTWASDVDLVVRGLLPPARDNAHTSPSYRGAERAAVSRALDRLARQLRRSPRLELAALSVIRSARVPIIRLTTMDTLVTADVSVHDASGPRAARWVAEQCRAFPALAPLTAVLKVFLKSRGLNDVATGGLGSFALVNMIVAHLLEEEKAAAGGGGAGKRAAAAASSSSASEDLGEALYGFLLRYGDGYDFDYGRDAVAVAHGGVVAKATLRGLTVGGGGSGSGSDSPAVFTTLSSPASSSLDGLAPPLSPSRISPTSSYEEERLWVDDPLTGREVAGGSYRVGEVAAAFSEGARRLERMARRHAASSSSGVSDNELTPNYLEALFDVRKALTRPGWVTASWADDDEEEAEAEDDGFGAEEADEQRAGNGNSSSGGTSGGYLTETIEQLMREHGAPPAGASGGGGREGKKASASAAGAAARAAAAAAAAQPLPSSSVEYDDDDGSDSEGYDDVLAALAAAAAAGEEGGGASSGGGGGGDGSGADGGPKKKKKKKRSSSARSRARSRSRSPPRRGAGM
jgi:non-canonical poly(A) RNA polymerase PAPD5/7